jgi:hypothetical protein
VDRGLTGNFRHRPWRMVLKGSSMSCSDSLTSRVKDRESPVAFAMVDEREGGAEEERRCCPRCGAADPRTTLLTFMARYLACRRCEYRWQTPPNSKRNPDVEQE